MDWPSFLLILTLTVEIAISQSTYSTPDIKVIQYIKDDGYFVGECYNDLEGTLKGQIDTRLVESDDVLLAACTALD